MSAPPRVSVILAAYRSAATIGGCLTALARQTYRDFETLVVDSSPDDACAEIIGRFPGVHLERSPQRLLPHAARNRGVELARGEILVFSDPDIYPAADWLARMVATYERTGHLVVSALTCHGKRWLDRGIHRVKFPKWLPGGEPRAVDNGPTAGLLVDRATFEALGSFPGEAFQGDALFSWRAVAAGRTLWLEPRAVAEHHHLESFRGFIHERYRRGTELGDLRADWRGFGRSRLLFFLAVSILPVRLGRVTILAAREALRPGAGGLAGLLPLLPVVLAGHAATLAGEARAYLRRLIAVPVSASPAAHPSSPSAG